MSGAARAAVADDGPLDALFGALADPTRRALVITLVQHGPQSATRLAAGGPLTRQAVVKHLQALEAAGLVTAQRAGREVLFRATPEQLAAAVGWLLDAGATWDRRIDRLRVGLPRRPASPTDIGQDRVMLDHLSIQCADVAAAAAFYDAVLAPLGGSRVMDFGTVIGYGVGFPDFWIGPREHPDDSAGQPPHIAFRTDSRAAVDAFHQAALGVGAVELHAPKIWPEYHPDYYGAFVRDPDGNNVEAVCHTPSDATSTTTGG